MSDSILPTTEEIQILNELHRELLDSDLIDKYRKIYDRFGAMHKALADEVSYK